MGRIGNIQTIDWLSYNLRGCIGGVLLCTVASCAPHGSLNGNANQKEDSLTSKSEMRVSLIALGSVLKARKAIWDSTDDINSNVTKLAWNMPLWTDTIGSWLPLAPYISPELSRLLLHDYAASDKFKLDDFKNANIVGHRDRKNRYDPPLTPGAKKAIEATMVYSPLSSIPVNEFSFTQLDSGWVAIGRSDQLNGETYEFRVIFTSLSNEHIPRIINIEKRIRKNGKWADSTSFKRILKR